MVYLDNNATTQALPAALTAAQEAMERYFGNPSSQHGVGREARRALESARAHIASAVGAAHASQIIFTSGGTESINLMFSLLLTPVHCQIVISAVEHHAVSAAAHRWTAGRSVREIPVDGNGALDLAYLESILKAGPALVSLIGANNETGVLWDVAVAAQICRRHGATLHVDAVQMPGRVPFGLQSLDCDMASLSAHKFHGPKGCGVLYVKAPREGGQSLLPGHQEFGWRGGTENLPAIAGTARAAAALPATLAEMTRVAKLRDELEQGLLAAIPGAAINGGASARLPQTSNVYFPGRNAADLVTRLSRRGIYVSAGAACSTGQGPSHVLRAMGYSEERANGSLRLSLSRLTTPEEVRTALTEILEAYETTLRASVG